MVERPTGTVSFLFSDIEGSTKLLQALGGTRYAEQLERHRALLRERFEANGGYEVDTEGDSFFVAFRSANDAAQAASEAQQALAAADWPNGHEVRVRIGIHTGEPLVVGRDYVGVDVHKAARIMGAANGGQVILSEATRRLLDDRFELRDLGERRLKDLLAPERLYQLTIPGLPNTFPRLRTLEGRTTNLPAPVSDFIGRESEVQQLVALMRDERRRLLTLTGVGGTGKTRLALSVAAKLIDDFPGGVYFAPLSAFRDGGLVLAEIAKALLVSEEPGQPLATTVAEAIGTREVLLFLDSFDRVRSAASELTGLLEACPGLSILVTSRVPLGIGGETIYPVPPLAPDEALDLLVSRAQAFGVRLERADPALVMVAERVECLPLALELAAGRLRLLPAAELATQIEEAVFESGRLEFAPTRQQTVRSMIDWSYELLSEEERQLFARLSVFSASAPLDALRAIAGADLETLSGLVSAGLVRRLEAPGGQAHFGLPAIVQAYARERLRQSGEEPAIARAHAVYFLELARRLRASPPSRRVLEGQGNYWAALDWAKEHDAGLAGELGSVLGELFRSQGRVREQRTVIAALKHMPPPPPTIPKETEARPDSRPPADGPDTGPSADGPDTRFDLEQGSTLLETGEYDQAAEQLARVLKRAREARDGALESTAALYLGYAELRRGAYPQALRSLLIALRTIEADETTPLLAAPCFEGFAALAAATGEVVHAARMQGAASSFSGEVVADDVVAKLRSETAATLVALMGQERYGEACAAGAQLSFSEAAAEARIGTH